jgi:hypothetical protein
MRVGFAVFLVIFVLVSWLWFWADLVSVGKIPIPVGVTMMIGVPAGIFVAIASTVKR